MMICGNLGNGKMVSHIWSSEETRGHLFSDLFIICTFSLSKKCVRGGFLRTRRCVRCAKDTKNEINSI